MWTRVLMYVDTCTYTWENTAQFVDLRYVFDGEECTKEVLIR